MVDILRPEKKQGWFSKVAGGLGSLVGAGVGLAAGGPGGAALGAKIGGGAGGAAGALSNKGGGAPGAISPMQRRMEQIDSTPLNDVIQAKSALATAPVEVQQQAAPILDEALKVGQRRRPF